MMKKFRNLVFLFFLTSSCGYNPIYEEGSKFSLISVDLDGDKKINRVIYGKLYSFLNLSAISCNLNIFTRHTL